MRVMTGVSAAKGHSSGKAVVKTLERPKVTKNAITDPENEITRFRAAQNTYDARLAQLTSMTEHSVGREVAEIFHAYRLIVSDETFFKTAFTRVENELCNMEYAISEECRKITELFTVMDSEYMRERATDINNVCDELINIMMGINSDIALKIADETDAILVAQDLTPAETIMVDKSVLRGIITEHGGITSHTVILAKALDIPVIVGAKSATQLIKDGDFLLLDAFAGIITINPTQVKYKAFIDIKKQLDDKNALYKSALQKPAVTRDGRGISVRVNTGDSHGIKEYDAVNSDGVGLFRTEFLYMKSPEYPGEDMQFEVYKDIAVRAKGKPVIIRTLDIGGDKHVPYMRLPAEENPFLGYRGIRFCLDHKEVFAEQIRAILRASAFGNVSIMFPMIVTMEELLAAKACVEKEKQTLRKKNIKFSEEISVGAMIETPAAVLLSDQIAKHVSFFSIGSNDLIQYTAAADRMNERISHLYESFNISVLRAIQMVAQSAEKAGIPWGICGEVASETRLVPLWVALGVDELSVVPSRVGEIKHLINKLSHGELQEDTRVILNYSLIDDAKSHLGKILKKHE